MMKEEKIAVLAGVVAVALGLVGCADPVPAQCTRLADGKTFPMEFKPDSNTYYGQAGGIRVAIDYDDMGQWECSRRPTLEQRKAAPHRFNKEAEIDL